MNRLIEENREELERLCRRYRVRRIDLFGSATRPNFDSAHSDLDFLVAFQELGQDQWRSNDWPRRTTAGTYPTGNRNASPRAAS
jgi:predicted nucleotidyltransferase